MSHIDSFMRGLRWTRAVGLSGYTLLVWDFLLTFEDELRYIWPTRWSIVKIIFLANRYGNLIGLGIVNAQQTGLFRSSSRSFCFDYTLISTILFFLSYTSIPILVLLRAWALLRHRRKIAYTLIALFIFNVTVSLSILAYGLVLSGYDAFIMTNIIGTCINFVPSWAWVIWLPGIVLESGVFALTVVSLQQYSQGSISPLIRTLYRDGITFFAASLFSSVFNIAIWVRYPADPRNLLAIVMCLCVVNVAGQRLVLELRIINARSEELTTGRVGEIIDQQIAAFSPVFMIDHAEGNGTVETPDVELKGVNDLDASMPINIITETSRMGDPEYATVFSIK